MKKNIAILSLIVLFFAATSMTAQTTPVKKAVKTECCKDKQGADKAKCATECKKADKTCTKTGQTCVKKAEVKK